MEARLSLDLEKPEAVGKAVEPSLSDNGDNRFVTELAGDSLEIQIHSESTGPLRGCVDAAMRLTKLSEKITER